MKPSDEGSRQPGDACGPCACAGGRQKPRNRRKEAGGGGRKGSHPPGGAAQKMAGWTQWAVLAASATVLPQSYLRPPRQYLAVRESTGRGVGVCTSSFSPKNVEFPSDFHHSGRIGRRAQYSSLRRGTHLSIIVVV